MKIIEIHRVQDRDIVEVAYDPNQWSMDEASGHDALDTLLADEYGQTGDDAEEVEVWPGIGCIWVRFPAA